MGNREAGKARGAARKLALGVVVTVLLLAGVPGAAQGRPAAGGCSAWRIASGVGIPTCRWEAHGDGGWYGAGFFTIRVYRDGALVTPSWDGFAVGCSPANSHLGFQATFRAGDVVEVEVREGFVHVGTMGGIVC